MRSPQVSTLNYAEIGQVLVTMKQGAKFEIEEVFADAAATHEEPQKLEWPIARGRLLLLSFLMFGTLFVFAGRVFYLTVLKSALLASRAEAARERHFPILPLRGVIYDRSGTALVKNEPGINIFLDSLFVPRDDDERAALFAELEGLLGFETGSLESSYAPYRNRAQLFEIASGVSSEIAVAVSVRELPGVRVEESFVRRVTKPEALSSLVGYLGAAQDPQLAGLRVGQAGIEAAYNDFLAGSSGQRLVIVDAKGRARNEQVVRDAAVGHDAFLHLDTELTEVLWEALERQRRRAAAPAAAAVALDPRSGAVLSMVSTPSVDANALNQGVTHQELARLQNDPRHPFVNRVVAGLYPSGSSVKPFVALAALAENVISPNRSVLAQGSITVPSVYDPSITYTFLDWKTHGWVNVRDAIAVSSNVYFYTVGGGFGDIQGLGIERLARWLSRFGFGEKLGIDFPGEAAGRVPTPAWKQETKKEQWFIGDTYNLSIGQGDFAATPLQLATATAAIANGGKVFQPQVASAIKDSFGGVVREFSPQALHRINAPKEAFEAVQQGMRMSVSSPQGTNRAMADLAIKVAAKTGTAQAPREKLHAWVTAYAPYDDPQIVLAIVIEEGGQGTVATAVAKEVLAWYAENRL